MEGTTFIKRTAPVPDLEVSALYPDLSIGDSTTGNISGGSQKSNYLFDIKVADSPSYGDAVIHDFRYGLYFESVANATLSNPSALSVWQLKEPLGTSPDPQGSITEGVRDIIQFASRDENQAGQVYLTENFEGEFPQRVLNELRVGISPNVTQIKTGPYIFLDEAHAADYGVVMSLSKMADRYASKDTQGRDIIYVEESKNWPGQWTPKKGKSWKQNDPNWFATKDNWEYKATYGGFGDTVQIFHTQTLNVSDNAITPLEDALHTENSIFDVVKNTAPVVTADHTIESPQYHAFAMTSRSGENTLSGSKSAKLQCKWSTGIPASFSMAQYYSGRSPNSADNSTYAGPKGRQETFFAKKDIPAPVSFAQSDQNDASIEFDLNFEKLDKAYLYTSSVDSDSSGTSYYASLRRAFIYTQGEIMPAADETIYDYLSLNYCWNWKITALTKENNKTTVTIDTNHTPCGSFTDGDCTISAGDTVYIDFANTSHMNENGVLTIGNDGLSATHYKGGGHTVDSVDASGGSLVIDIDTSGDDPADPSSEDDVGTIYKFSNKNFFGMGFLKLDGTASSVLGEGIRVIPFTGQDGVSQSTAATITYNNASTTCTVTSAANKDIYVGQTLVGSDHHAVGTTVSSITESGGSGTGVTSFVVSNAANDTDSSGDTVTFTSHNIGDELRTWFPNAAALDFVARVDSGDANSNTRSSFQINRFHRALLNEQSWYNVCYHFNPSNQFCIAGINYANNEDELDTYLADSAQDLRRSDAMRNMRAATNGTGHGATATTTSANGLQQSSWPSAACLWLTNVDHKNQTSIYNNVSALNMGNEDAEIGSTARDTQSDVFVSQMRLRGFNWSHSNASINDNNMSGRGQLGIKGGQTRRIHADATENNTRLYSVDNFNAWALGFDNITDVQGASRWLLFNGFYCTNIESATAYTDSDCDVIFTSEENFGKQVPPTSGGASQLGFDTGSDGISSAHPITSDGTNMVEGFRGKGWLNFAWDDATIHTANKNWIKRENLYASARVIGKRPTRGTSAVYSIEIAKSDENLFALANDEEYILYLYNEEWQAPSAGAHTESSTNVALSGIKITSKDFDVTGSFIEFDTDISTIMTDDNLKKGTILLSPYRYWLSFYFDPGTRPDISYTSVGPTATATPQTSGFIGTTFNEFLYNDTTTDSVIAPYINSWNLTPDGDESALHKENDYGYGVYDKETGQGGYVNTFIPRTGYTEVNLGGVLKAYDDILAGDTLSFMISQQDDLSESRSTIRTKNYSGTTSDPYLSTIFFDALPERVQNFKVSPNKDNPFYPEFTWSVNDSDLWYGFLSFSDGSIINQYDGAVIHYPLNEEGEHETDISAPTENISGMTTVLYDGTGSTPTYHVEGLAGNAVYFDGGQDYIKSGTGNASDWSSITDEMSIVLHCIPDSVQPSIGSGAEIIQQTNWTKVQVNSSRQVEFYVYSAANRYVKCVSSSTIPTDGETPFNIIATFDASLDTGNLKLFFNGVLEDQSGVVVSAHGSDAEFTGWIQNTNRASNSNYFQIGGGIAGRVEEVVVYNKVLYPVVPENGKYTLTKPLEELKDGFDITESKSNVARLFIKDFHNIRGSLSNQVRASENIAWRKAAFALETD